MTPSSARSAYGYRETVRAPFVSKPGAQGAARIAENYGSIGWEQRRRGHYLVACRADLAAVSINPSWVTIRGFFASVLTGLGVRPDQPITHQAGQCPSNLRTRKRFYQTFSPSWRRLSGALSDATPGAVLEGSLHSVFSRDDISND